MTTRPIARHRLLFLGIVLAAGVAAPAGAQQPDTAAAPAGPAASQASCKCDATSVGNCFTVRGSVAIYRTAPTARLAVAGSKRVLALRGGMPDFMEEDLETPGNQVVGEYVVCPLTRPKPGVMQLVYIVSAHDMVVKPKR